MRVLFTLGAASFLFALVLTPLCRNLLRHFGMMDHPDQDRKLHQHPIPTMGGIPILFAYLASFGVLMFAGQRAQLSGVNFTLALRLAPAIAIIFLTGLLDDRFRLQPVQKIVLQIFAAGW